jgi:hypothetical protein
VAELTFPQLSSGATAQFPLRKLSSYHVVLNTTEDGESFSYFDPTSGRVFWNLSLTSLMSTEVSLLQSLFEQCYGRWAAFLFLDPTDNLFSSSVDLLNTAWSAPAGLTVSAGAGDPMGGLGAFQITNGSQVASNFGQTLQVPPNYIYTFSTFVLASAPTKVSLVRSSETEEAVDVVSVNTGWTRVASQKQLTNPGSSVTFGLSLEPGQQICVFGLQSEAQPEASEFYRPTYSTGGIYPNAHFAMDALTISADAPGQYSTSISIEATR